MPVLPKSIVYQNTNMAAAFYITNTMRKSLKQQVKQPVLQFVYHLRWTNSELLWVGVLMEFYLLLLKT